jgi:autotransporter-associated beta strand protein
MLAGSIAGVIAATLTCKLQAAAIITEPGITFDFALPPGVTEWSTTTIAGAAGDIVDVDAMNARVATITASQINGALVTSATAGGSGTNAQARHNTTELYVSTRPTGVALTPLMATLENGAAGRITSLAIDYDFGSYAAMGESPGLDGHLVYFSLDGAAWTKIDALSGIGTAGKLSATVNVATWEQGAPLYLLWVDDNGPATDGGFTLDNVHLVPTVEPFVVGRTLVYNRNHTVGGAPNGTLATSGNYFLQGNTPTAFATTDMVNFSQDGSATVDVPADVTTGGIVVSNTTGIYTIGGVGKMKGPFTKSNGGSVVFTSVNDFNKSTITGGTVETRAGALGSGVVTMSGGATWKVTTAAQNQNGPVSVGTGGATIQTDSDLSAGGIDGDGLLTKTGVAGLTLRGGGSGTGGINVTAGKLSLGGAVGGAGEKITMNGHLLEFVNTGEITFSDATTSRFIDLGATGGTISVASAGAGVIFAAPDTLASGGTITKIGDGALRMRADHSLISSNWVVNAGTLESGAALAAVGTGTVTVNAGGRLASQNTIVPNNVILAGGDLTTRSGDLADFTGTVNVTANSTVTMHSYTTPANAQNVTISGVLSGIGDLTLNGNIVADPTLAKALILTNTANTYAGSIRVSEGQTLQLDGDLTSTASQVSVTGTLAGRGTIAGKVTANAAGTISPGPGTAILSVGGNVVMSPTSILALDVAHSPDATPVAGIDYDQIEIGTGTGAVSTASVTLDGAELRLTLGTGILENDVFFILLNDGVDSITGTFQGLADDSFLNVNGQGFRISYDANSNTGLLSGGNDVALVAIPEPSSAALLLLAGGLLLPRRTRR